MSSAPMMLVTGTRVASVLLLLLALTARQVVEDTVRRTFGIDLNDFGSSTMLNMGYNIKIRMPRQPPPRETSWKDEL